MNISNEISIRVNFIIPIILFVLPPVPIRSILHDSYLKRGKLVRKSFFSFFPSFFLLSLLTKFNSKFRVLSLSHSSLSLLDRECIYRVA